MKRFLMTLGLVCVLSSLAFAGDVPSGGSPQPPPPQGMTQATDATSPGDIPCDLAAQLSEATLSGLMTAFDLLVF
jgi:hypothetical protein